MKNIKAIILIILGVIIVGVIGAKAATLISSSQVIYKDNKTVDVALNNLFDELKTGKDKLAQAITNKGVTTTSDNTLEEMATNVENIVSDKSATYKYLIKDGEYVDGEFTTNSVVTKNEIRGNRRLWYGTATSTGGPRVYKEVDVTDYDYVVFTDCSYYSGVTYYGVPTGVIGIGTTTNNNNIATIIINNAETLYKRDIIFDISNVAGNVYVGWHNTAVSDTYLPFLFVKDIYLVPKGESVSIPKETKESPLYLYKDGVINDVPSIDIYLYSLTETDTALQSQDVIYAGFNTSVIYDYSKAYIKVRQEGTTVSCRYGLSNSTTAVMPSVVSGSGRVNNTDVTPTSESTIYEIDLVEGRGIYFGTLAKTTGIYIEEIWLE